MHIRKSGNNIHLVLRKKYSFTYYYYVKSGIYYVQPGCGGGLVEEDEPGNVRMYVKVTLIISRIMNINFLS